MCFAKPEKDNSEWLLISKSVTTLPSLFVLFPSFSKHRFLEINMPTILKMSSSQHCKSTIL